MDNILFSVISFCETNSKVIEALEARENHGNKPFGILAKILQPKAPYEKLFLVQFDYFVTQDQNPQTTPEDVAISSLAVTLLIVIASGTQWSVAISC